MSLTSRRILFAFGLMILAAVAVLATIRPGWLPYWGRGDTPQNQNATSTPPVEPTAVDSGEQFYDVVAVLTGDSIAVNMQGKMEIVQVIGMHVPYAGALDEPVECYAVPAARQASKLLGGKRVALHGDGTQDERDKFGRLLRYVFLSDGTDYGKFMIQNGYAYERTTNLKTAYQAQDAYKQAEKEAKSAKRGVWSDSSCLNLGVRGSGS